MAGPGRIRGGGVGGLLLAALALVASGLAAPAHVRGVTLARKPYGIWEGLVLIDHEDQGWEHFVDRWEVLDQAGRRIVLRTLDGPKLRDVEEDGPVRRRHQAFPIPEGTTRLVYRAHCKRSGWIGKPFEVDLAAQRGAGFEIGVRGTRYLPHFEGLAAKMRTWRAKKHVLPEIRWPHPPRGPVPPQPPDPVDARPAKGEPSVPEPRGESEP